MVLTQNTAGSNELLNYHMKCQPELTYLLQGFNILFYGYGCKQALLKSMFPEAVLFNLQLQTLRSITSDLVNAGFGTKRCTQIAQIDKWLGTKQTSLTLVLVNFDLRLVELADLKNIRLIATLENINFSFSLDAIRPFNFVFRDLTTFENYSSEILGLEIAQNRVKSALLVFGSVPRKAKCIFKELLSLGTCDVAVLFDKVKMLLMLTKKGAVVDLLHEFEDHGIVKRRDGARIVLNLNKEERRKLLEEEAIKSFAL